MYVLVYIIICMYVVFGTGTIIGKGVRRRKLKLKLKLILIGDLFPEPEFRRKLIESNKKLKA